MRFVENVSFIRDSLDNVSRTSRNIIVFDPFHTDANHVREYARAAPVEQLRVPFGGHHVWRAFSAAKIGDTGLVSMLRGDADLSWITRKIRASRRGSWWYFRNRALSTLEEGALKRAMDLDVLGLLATLPVDGLRFAASTTPDMFSRADAQIELLSQTADETVVAMHRRRIQTAKTRLGL